MKINHNIFSLPKSLFWLLVISNIIFGFCLQSYFGSFWAWNISDLAGKNEVLIEDMLALTPDKKWTQDNGNDVHLVITGGEPLLGWQQLYPDLLSENKMRDFRRNLRKDILKSDRKSVV